MPFTSDIAQAIAQQRAQMGQQGVRQAPVSMIPGRQIGGYEPWGEGARGAGQGLGALFASKMQEAKEARDPEQIAKKADSLQSRLWSMEDQEMRKKFVSTQEVQERLRYWQRHNPTIPLMDMGEVHGDEKYKGLLDFPHVIESEEQKKLKAQAKLPYAKTEASRLKEAEISATEEAVKTEKAIRPGRVELQRVEAEAGRTATSAAMLKMAREEELHPLEMDLLRAQIAKLKADRDRILAEKEPVDETMKRALKIRQDADDALMTKFKYEDLAMSPETYAIQDVQLTKNMTDALGYARIEGIDTPVPAAITEPSAVQWVNKSINEAFMAALRNPNMSKKDRVTLYNEVAGLYGSTYGFLMSPTVINKLPGAQAYIDPQAIAKLAYIEYVAYGDEWTEEERKVKMQKLLNNFPVDMLVGEQRTWSERGWSFLRSVLQGAWQSVTGGEPQEVE